MEGLREFFVVVDCAKQNVCVELESKTDISEPSIPRQEKGKSPFMACWHQWHNYINNTKQNNQQQNNSQFSKTK